MGYSPWGRKESDTTERLSLSLPTSVQLSSMLASFRSAHSYSGPKWLQAYVLTVKSSRKMSFPTISIKAWC